VAHVKVLLVCSADGCAELFEAYGPLEEVEALACDCGYGLQPLAWPAELERGERRDGLELVPLERW
jgi:hypothetical protein